ncbi:hypothetical protein LXA43DRAFT_1027019 [Ganoderma leucocontextum]|nr:hypothetical protein LXA43DRAFT_1027019 [Ganoderma leucocontextum]
MFFSQDSPRPFMVTPCREMGLDKLELLTKSVFQDVETLKLLPVGAENSRCLRCELRSLQAAFHEGLVIIKTLSNAACPINRLPPEILAHIFALIPGRRPYGDVETGVHWPFAQTIVEDLHALPKVCRSWRELALATPALWTTVSTSCSQSEDAIDFYLRHSIYLPEDPSLELKIHLASAEVVPRIKELLLRNAPRVRELYHLADLPDRELCEVHKSFDAEALEKCLLLALNPSAPRSSTPLNQARFLPFFSGGGAPQSGARRACGSRLPRPPRGRRL